MSEGLVLTSDSENEIFCDSLDTVEQLGGIKVQHPVGRNDAVLLACHVLLQGLRHATKVQMNKGTKRNDFCLQPPPVSSNGFHNGHALELSPCEIPPLDSHRKFRQVGAGQGGEGAEDGKGHGPSRRGRDAGREGSYHNWRDRKPLYIYIYIYYIVRTL